LKGYFYLLCRDDTIFFDDALSDGIISLIQQQNSAGNEDDDKEYPHMHRFSAPYHILSVHTKQSFLSIYLAS
jgi:hypothetical protein